jgi:hypothetical protein
MKHKLKVGDFVTDMDGEVFEIVSMDEDSYHLKGKKAIWFHPVLKSLVDSYETILRKQKKFKKELKKVINEK